MMNGLLRNIKRVLVEEGLVYIFGSSIVGRIGGLISLVFVTRLLPKADYGNYVWANTLYSYVALFMGMGLSVAIMQFCSEPIEEAKKNAIYKYALKKGTMFNLLIFSSVCLMSYFQYQMGNDFVSKCLLLMSGYPFFTYLLNCMLTILRVKRENKIFSNINMINAAVLLFGNILFTKIYGVYGLIISTYFANIFPFLSGFIYDKVVRTANEILSNKVILLKSEKNEIDKYSLTSSITDFTYAILLLIDVTCIGVIIPNHEILADYKIASLLPNSLAFVSTCLMTFYYPKIIENYYKDKKGIIKYLKKLFFVFGIVNFAIFVFSFLLATIIIKSLFGEQYISSVPIFRILIFNFLLSSVIRKIMGNLIAIMKKIHINFKHCVISGIMNIFLNLLLIPRFGAIGAAIATTICTVFMSILELRFFYYSIYIPARRTE